MIFKRHQHFSSILRASSAITAIALLAVTPAFALPQDGQVVGGQATITASGSQTTITQSTHRGIINWQSFDIGAGEHVQFIQPSSTSVTLNRVTDGSASQILGNLTANGTVMLVNPQGTFIGPNANVNVGSFLATTTDIANDRFMAGDYRFDRPGNPDAGIVNQGSVTVADAGLAAFVAPNVVNNGLIEAKLGKVQLASGDTFALDLYGDGLFALEAGPAITSQLVSNGGIIAAEGGKVLMTAAAAGEVVNSLINMDGIIQATSIGEQNGEIVIFAEGSNAVTGNDSSKKGQRQGNSNVIVSGILDASGRKTGERGGKITVTGDNVALLDGTLIDTSGHTGLAGTTDGKEVSAHREGSAGGDIRIGGDYKGDGHLATAQSLIVESGVTILNDSLFSGDAGRSVFWSDGGTQFYGRISSRAYGGLTSESVQWSKETTANAGNGGFVETSGKQLLTVGGLADTRSAGGSAGTWLLDPATLTLTNRTDGTANGANIINAAQLETMSIGGNVNLSATGSVTFDLTGDDILMITDHDLSITSDTGDILTASQGTITASGTGSILLDAGRDITLSHDFDLVANTGDVTLRANRNILYSGSGDITTAGGAITLNADRDQETVSGGAISLDSGTELRSNGGTIILGGGLDPSAGQAWGTNATTALRSGITLNSTTLSSGTGDIHLNGQGGTGTSSARGIYITGGSVIQTTSGAITLHGYGGAGFYGNTGIVFTGANHVLTQDGDIFMHGWGGDSTQYTNYGLNVAGGTVIESSGLGNVDLRGNGGTSTNDGLSYGFRIENAGSIVRVKDGNLTITGIAGATNPIQGYNNRGVAIFSGSLIESTGVGTITMSGTGGANGTTGNRGVDISDSTIRTNNADVDIRGIGGTGSVAGTHDGVSISNAMLSSTGNGQFSITGQSTDGPDIVINSVSIGESPDPGTASGDIYIVADTVTASGVNSIQTSGKVVFAPRSSDSTIGVAGGAGTLQLTGALLSAVSAGEVTIGRSDGSGLVTLNGRDWLTPVNIITGIGGITVNGAQNMGAHRFYARTYGASDITMNSGGIINSSATNTAITLAAGSHFINNAGSDALSAPAGRWLVYSTNPANDKIGSLASDFRRFSCSYGGSCPAFPVNGNGFLYSHPAVAIEASLGAGEVARVQLSQQPSLAPSGFVYPPASGHMGFISEPRPDSPSQVDDVDTLSPSIGGSKFQHPNISKPEIMVDRELQDKFDLPPWL